MVAIVNVSDNPDLTGVQEYEVRINSKVICKFTHVRENELAECLRKAADAVDNNTREIYLKMMLELKR